MANSQEADFAIMIELLREISRKLDKGCGCQPKDAPKLFSGCPVCGLLASDGPMGYVCPNPKCPSAVRGTS